MTHAQATALDVMGAQPRPRLVPSVPRRAPSPRYPHSTVRTTVRCIAEYDAEGEDIALSPDGTCGCEIEVSAECWRDGLAIDMAPVVIPDRCPRGHTWDRSDRRAIETAAEEALSEVAYEGVCYPAEREPCDY